MLELGYGTDGRQVLDCSYSLAPHNAATAAVQAFHEYQFNGDIEAALEKFDEAIEKDPANPEWPYQALQLALQKGDRDRADDYLACLPESSSTSPGGWRGTLPPGNPSAGGMFCCPCDPPTTFSNVSDCTANCQVSLACFVGICAYNGQCQGYQNPFAIQLKLCVPPSELQICFTFDTNGTFGVQVGASLFEGFLGVGAGFNYNPFNNKFNLVLDVNTAKLPINTGATLTYDPSSGKASAALGLSNQSNSFTGQYTLLSNLWRCH